jgi:hypothetical protein
LANVKTKLASQLIHYEALIRTFTLLNGIVAVRRPAAATS